MKISEKLLDGGGIQLVLDKEPSIYGEIKLENDLYVIDYWYKAIFQNQFHEDTMNDAKVKLKNLLINAYKQFQLDERNVYTFKQFLNESNTEKELGEIVFSTLKDIIRLGDIKNLKDMIEHLNLSKSEINTVRNNRDLLIYAIYSDIEMVEYLLSIGADTNNIKMKEQNSALIHAILSESENKIENNVIDILVKNGANLNHVGQRQKTALMFSINWFDMTPITHKLIQYDADWNLKDENGDTFVDYLNDKNKRSLEYTYHDKYDRYIRIHKSTDFNL